VAVSLFIRFQMEGRPSYKEKVRKWIEALSMYSRNKDALDLLIQKIEGVLKFTVCLLR